LKQALITKESVNTWSSEENENNYAFQGSQKLISNVSFYSNIMVVKVDIVNLHSISIFRLIVGLTDTSFFGNGEINWHILLKEYIYFAKFIVFLFLCLSTKFYVCGCGEYSTREDSINQFELIPH